MQGEYNIVLLTVHHYVIVAHSTHACTVCKYIQIESPLICSFLFVFFSPGKLLMEIIQCFDASVHCAVLRDISVFSRVLLFNLSHKLIASCVRQRVEHWFQKKTHDVMVAYASSVLRIILIVLANCNLNIKYKRNILKRLFKAKVIKLKDILIRTADIVQIKNQPRKLKLRTDR